MDYFLYDLTLAGLYYNRFGAPGQPRQIKTLTDLMSLPVDKLSTLVNDHECTIDLEALRNEFQMLESR